MKPTWRTTFTVVGTMSFPDDMLRHDACEPATPRDAEIIKSKTWPYPSREAARSQVRVELTHVGESKNWTPTAGRWNSFAWGVDLNSIKTEEIA